MRPEIEELMQEALARALRLDPVSVALDAGVDPQTILDQIDEEDE